MTQNLVAKEKKLRNEFAQLAAERAAYEASDAFQVFMRSAPPEHVAAYITKSKQLQNLTDRVTVLDDFVATQERCVLSNPSLFSQTVH